MDQLHPKIQTTMLAVPFLFMVASTRRGRIVLLTVLCVMVSAIRSSYQSDNYAASDTGTSSFVALGRFDWHDDDNSHTDIYTTVQHEAIVSEPLRSVKKSVWSRVHLYLPLGRLARPPRPVAAAFDVNAHLSTIVSPEEVAHHLRQPRSVLSSSSSSSWLSRFVAATPLLRQRRNRPRKKQPQVGGAIIIDGQLSSPESTSTSSSSSSSQDMITLQSLAEPLMLSSVWNSLTGTEFQQHPDLVEGLAAMGERLVRSPDGDGWIDWKDYGKHAAPFDKDDCETIQVWTGRAKRAERYHGADVPFVKSRSRIPLSPTELKDLLLDSSRIKTYNPWSTGRQDCWTSAESEQQPQKKQTAAALADDSSSTKIVKNKVQPPVGSALVGVTLLHARPLNQGAWLVVSRSIGGQAFFDAEDLTNAGRSDILLGVNLIEPVADDEDSCIMTSITHAASSSIPSMLAERFGVKGAVKFVQDIRKLKVLA